jgi:hypothetical protein
MSEIPDNVDLNWIAHRLVRLQDEVRAVRQIGDAALLRREIVDLREDVRSMRDQLDLAVSFAMRLERGQNALRDDNRMLFELHGDLRRRIEVLEGKEGK